MAKTSEIVISVNIGRLKFLDSYRFLDADFDKISTTLTFCSSLDADGAENELFKRNLAYPYQKFQIIESFYRPLELRGDFVPL